MEKTNYLITATTLLVISSLMFATSRVSAITYYGGGSYANITQAQIDSIKQQINNISVKLNSTSGGWGAVKPSTSGAPSTPVKIGIGAYYGASTSGGKAVASGSVNLSSKPMTIGGWGAPKIGGLSATQIQAQIAEISKKIDGYKVKLESPTTCYSEGQGAIGYQVAGAKIKSCCAPLVQLPRTACGDADCSSAPTTEGFICTNCGDGICGLGENKINCAKDCVKISACTGTDCQQKKVFEKKTVKFSELDRYYLGCQAGQPFSFSCISAAHSYCRANGFASGYGPVESNATNADIVCIPANYSNLIHSTFSELANYDKSCSPSSPTSDKCGSAINRLCAAKGYLNGIGIVDSFANEIYGTCVSGSSITKFNLTLSELTTADAKCSNTNLTSPDCRKAAKNYCIAKGYSTSLGVIDYLNDNATVMCVKI